VNEVLREVVADELERLADRDDRLRLVTVTGVEVDADLRHATVWLSSINVAAATALDEERVRLQAAISRQVRLKRTPLLAFAPDPAVSAGQRVEEILRGLRGGDASEQGDSGV
jgi:ribosome-binding factor A